MDSCQFRRREEGLTPGPQSLPAPTAPLISAWGDRREHQEDPPQPIPERQRRVSSSDTIHAESKFLRPLQALRFIYDFAPLALPENVLRMFLGLRCAPPQADMNDAFGAFFRSLRLLSVNHSDVMHMLDQT